MTSAMRILDIVNTDHAALNFLVFRARWINEHTEFRNDIVCSVGPHLGRVLVEGSRIDGLYIPCGLDPVGIGRLLARLVRSGELGWQMGARGVEHVRRKSDEERVGERLVAIYRSALIARGLAAARKQTQPELRLAEGERL